MTSYDLTYIKDVTLDPWYQVVSYHPCVTEYQNREKDYIIFDFCPHRKWSQAHILYKLPLTYIKDIILDWPIYWPIYSCISQSACSTLDLVLNSLSDFDCVLYEHNWRISIIDIEVPRLAIVCPCPFRIMILCYSPSPKSGWKLGYG